MSYPSRRVVRLLNKTVRIMTNPCCRERASLPRLHPPNTTSNTRFSNSDFCWGFSFTIEQQNDWLV